ncbi:MAG TPA: carbonic anhydrase [Acidimicrobiales bacterium]
MPPPPPPPLPPHGPTPAIDALVAANGRFAADFDAARAGCDISSPRPTRRAAVVTCMDARIDLFAALGLALGEVHVIRNAGGIVTDDVLRSLVLSQRKLGTREVLLAQHTDCGLHGLDDDALTAEVEAEAGARPPFAFGGFTDLDASVRASLACLRGAPFVPHRDAVRGFVYDVATGRLREVV